MFYFRELHQTSPSALRAETSFRYQSDPLENQTCHTDEGGASLTCYQSTLISVTSFFSQLYFLSSGRSTNEILWEFVASSPFLCPSRLRRSLARSRETRFTRPNRRACSQARYFWYHRNIISMFCFRSLGRSVNHSWHFQCNSFSKFWPATCNLQITPPPPKQKVKKDHLMAGYLLSYVRHVFLEKKKRQSTFSNNLLTASSYLLGPSRRLPDTNTVNVLRLAIIKFHPSPSRSLMFRLISPWNNSRQLINLRSRNTVIHRNMKVVRTRIIMIVEGKKVIERKEYGRSKWNCYEARV